MADREIQTLGAVARPLPHDSAAAQISGTALYADDVPEAANILHGAFGLSSVAHARLTGLDLSAVQSAPGVVAVFSAINIPGKNDVSPFAGDDRLFAEDEVVYHGQALFLVVASSHQAARRAAKLGKAAYEPLPPLLTIAEAVAADSLIEPAQSSGARRRGGGFGGVRPTGSPAGWRVGGQDLFLSRRPDRGGDPAGAGGHACALLHPASERGAAYHRPRARAGGCAGDGGGAPHGRRLRRQGDPGLPVRRRGGAGGGGDRAAGENPRRPR
ncbi:xanthine dehydrogenase, molybdopterin binding subunit [Acidocella sp. MX-AZ02]|nr:xanthine dehydrogenase, molybdopterin binding subunit [Acidocella sp. MX-AZ02]